MPKSKRKEHLHVRSGNFRQVCVDDFFVFDDDGHFRICFGTYAPDDSFKRVDQLVILEAEISLTPDMAEHMRDRLTEWLDKVKRKVKQKRRAK